MQSRPQATASVLIVHDDPHLAQRLRDACTRPVRLARSADEALRRMRRERFGAVVCTVEGPGIDGFSFLAHVHESESRAAVVLCARELTPELRRRAAQYGAAGLVTADQDPDQIVRAIETAWDLSPPADREISDSSWGGRAPARPDPMPRIRGYKILRVLSRGGMGTVYEALQLELRQKVAVKVLRSTLSDRPDLCKRFLAEVRNVSSIDHPHVIRVYRMGLEERHQLPFFTMELIEGYSLQNLLRGRPRSFRQILEIARAVASSLEAAAALGIVHRDLKPANIMVDRFDRVVVLDFGLAKCFGFDQKLTRTGQVLGTPAYFSPEQAQGRPLDVRSDMYSLGVSLYEALAGASPFSARSAAGYIFLHCYVMPRSLEARGVPPELEGVLVRLLQKRPEDRYPTPAALCEQVAAVGRELERRGLLDARPEGVALRPVSFEAAILGADYQPLGQHICAAGRRRWVWALITVLLLVGAGSLVWSRLVPSSAPSWGPAVRLHLPAAQVSDGLRWQGTVGAYEGSGTGRLFLPLPDKGWSVEGSAVLDGARSAGIYVMSADSSAFGLRLTPAVDGLAGDFGEWQDEPQGRFFFALRNTQVSGDTVVFRCEVVEDVVGWSLANGEPLRRTGKTPRGLLLEVDAVEARVSFLDLRLQRLEVPAAGGD